MHTILGPDKFRAGTDLYFDRHDGEAATCEDFVAAMEDASGVDLMRFRLWYAQAGTPKVRATLTHGPGEGRAHLILAQEVPRTPGQPAKKPMPIPLKIALFGEVTGEKYADRLVLLEEEGQEILFEGIGERPILSINRDFSAPVIIETGRSAEDLAFLSANDDNPFARYEAMQQLMLDTLVGAFAPAKADHEAVIEAVRQTLTTRRSILLRRRGVLAPDRGLYRRSHARRRPRSRPCSARGLRAPREPSSNDLARRLCGDRPTASNIPRRQGRRRLRSVALGYLMAGGAEDAASMAMRQFRDATI
jgi:aminopeptidase N